MIVFLSIFSCHNEVATSTANTTSTVQTSETHSIDIPTLYQKMDQQPIIIDVRTPEEFATGHIPTAKNIPLSSLQDHIFELSHAKNSEIFLVCAVGGRSQQATTMMRSKGFTKAINVEGGTRGWQAKGFPTD